MGVVPGPIFFHHATGLLAQQPGQPATTGAASESPLVPPLPCPADLEPSDGSGPAAQQPRDAFTRNTRLVLGCLQAQFRPAPGSKRRHPSQGGLATDELRWAGWSSFPAPVQGGRCGRCGKQLRC